MACKNDFLELTGFTWCRDKNYWVGYGYLIEKKHLHGRKHCYYIFHEKDVRLCPYGATLEGYNKIDVIFDLRNAKKWCREHSLVPDNDKVLTLYKLKYDYWLSLSEKGIYYIRDLFFNGDESILNIFSGDGRWLFNSIGLDTIFEGEYCILHDYGGTRRKENCGVFLRKDCLLTREKAVPTKKCFVKFEGIHCLSDAFAWCRQPKGETI